MCLAIPGQVLNVENDDPPLRTGQVSFGGVTKRVSLACVPEARPGDYVLVHVGIAISTIDEHEAQRVFEYLTEMDELAELEDAIE